MKIIVRKQAEFEYDEDESIGYNREFAKMMFKVKDPKVEVILPKEVKVKSYRKGQ
jgi:hypothetical protein